MHPTKNETASPDQLIFERMLKSNQQQQLLEAMSKKQLDSLGRYCALNVRCNKNQLIKQLLGRLRECRIIQHGLGTNPTVMTPTLSPLAKTEVNLRKGTAATAAQELREATKSIRGELISVQYAYDNGITKPYDGIEGLDGHIAAGAHTLTLQWQPL